MRFGLVGLGKMGSNLGEHAKETGHEPIGYDPHAPSGLPFATVASLEELVKTLEPPRLIWSYVPHGAPTESVVARLAELLAAGDLLIDGGNSHWQDSQRHYQRLKQQAIGFLDVGTSGGIEGARHGACFMVGGDKPHFDRVAPLLRDVAVTDGVFYAGPAGAGHFVKLIHNAIEFGMLQAMGEGLDLMARSEFDLDLAGVFHNWAHGSVIRGWLVELMERGLRENKLDDLSGYVVDTREVRWAIEYALEKEAWIPVIAQSELALYRYRDPESVAGKGVGLLRHGFGGHPLLKKDDAPSSK
jgi:6-phosphogluconate dehydrogenase